MRTIHKFSATERVIFGLLIAIFSISVFVLVWNVNKSFMVPVPAAGGSLVEGVIGSPRFVNPILALSDVDRDLTTLVYSGLLKVENGELVPDLAKRYTISPDGLTYTFTLQDDIYFQDGEPITADDVEFTIQKAQDGLLKSPRRANWDGVSIEKISPTQIRFILKKPYAPFIENATLGILPKHIWKNVDVEQFTFSQYNIEPIGSGPYKLQSVQRDSGGLPQSYELTPYKKYIHGAAYISSLTLKFFSNEKLLLEAFSEGLIESMNSISPVEAAKLSKGTAHIYKTPLPRIFGVFFNQNQAPVLANKEIRQALNMVVDRDRIVHQVLNDYGTKIYSPIPAGVLPDATTTPAKTLEGTALVTRIENAKSLLEKNGWALNKDGILEKKVKNKDSQLLQFSLSTSNVPELKAAAEIVKEDWEALGARVTIKIFEAGDLNQNVIRPRKYDALLFGEIVGRDLDLFAFWHSSQRNDPGLNIAMYVNSKVDKLLEEARTLSDQKERLDRFVKIEDAVTSDIPAVFLYSPDFIYTLPEKIKGAQIEHITSPGDRFETITHWYINTDDVWKVFVK